MTRRLFVSITGHAMLLAAVALPLAPPTAHAQEASLTPWGDPDLQGTYTNKTTTPLQRPEDLSDREFLTAEEVAEREQAALERNEQLLLAPARRTTAGGNVGAYNNFWLDGGTRPTGRTSLISDPANGRLPALTLDSERRAEAREPRAEADSWEDLELNDRCLVWSAGPPMLPSAYNNTFMILQTPEYVAIQVEMIHDTRIIPLDRRPALSEDIRLWHGAPRGRWEGDTLVVETRRLRRTDANAAAVGGDPVLLRASNGRSDDTITVTERFRRVDQETVHYEFTIEDPAQWRQSFTGEFPFVKTDGLLYEYACHEGNYSMEGILAGERILEMNGPR